MVAQLLKGKYSYNTLRNEKSKKVPSQKVVEFIEEFFKEALHEDVKRTSPKDYPHSTDRPVLKEDEDFATYDSPKDIIVSKLRLLSKKLVKLTADVNELTADVNEVSKEIEDFINERSETDPSSPPDEQRLQSGNP